MPDKGKHRALYVLVWVGRITGWALIALAVLNLSQIGIHNRFAGGLSLVMSVALGMVGIAWVIALELFLTFFDRYLSRN